MILVARLNKFKSFLTTGVGVGIAQLIALFSVPYIARLVGPDIFGEYSFYNSLAIVLCVFATCKLEFAVYIISWRLYPYLKAFVSLMLPCTAFFLGLSVFFATDNTGILIYLSVSLLIFGASQFEFTIQDNVKKGKFTTNAYMRVCRAVLVPFLFTLLFSFYGNSVELIILSFAASNIIAASFMTKNRNKSVVSLKRVLNYAVVYELIKSCKKVLVFLVPGHFLNRYSATCLILIAGVFGTEAADIAQFALAEKLLIAPAGIITTALSDVLKREMLIKPINGLDSFYNFLYVSLPIAFVSSLAIYYFGSYFVVLFMGEEWSQLINFLIAMLPYYVSLVVFSPITHAYTVLNKQNIDFYWQVFHALVLTISVYIGLAYEFIVAVWFFSCTAAMSIFISAVICRKLLLNTDKEKTV